MPQDLVERSRTFIIAKFRCRWPTDPQPPLNPEAQRRIDQEIEVEVEVMEREHYTRLRQFREQAGLSGAGEPDEELEKLKLGGVGPPHGYEGGGSGRSHPENVDPDQQVAKKDEAKYTLLVEWKTNKSSKSHSYGNFGLGVEF
eukprot:COSAG05_NODE_670_length_7995_cov_87.891844_1_plen_142_part_10